MHLSDFARQYQVDHQISARTHRDYRLCVAGLEGWRNGPIDLDDLSPAILNCYLLWLTEQGLSLHTVHGRRNKLLILWRAAWAAGYTENAPQEARVRRIKPSAPNPVCWSVDDVRKLVAYCERHLRFPLRTVKVPAGDYLAALFRFLHDSGMRLGDAIDMEFAWLNGSYVTWRQQKTDRWHRARLSAETLAAIARIRTDARRMIWPRGRSDSGALYHLIRVAVGGAGLTGTSKYIRRGVATDVFRRGLDPGQALGHVPGSRVAIRWYVSREAQLEPVSATEL